MRPRPPTSSHLWAAVFVVMLLVVASVVPWRRGAIYAGGADAVVVAKAAVSVVALGLSLVVRRQSLVRTRLGGRSLSLLAAIVAVSTLGAVGTGELQPSLVLAVRIVIVATTVAVLVSASPPRAALTALLAAMGVVAVFAGLTGAILGDAGRLAGGLPEMAPNVLAGVAAPPLVALSVAIARHGIRMPTAAASVVLLAIVLATGSRTTLLVVLAGVLLVLLHVRRLPASTMIVAIATVPAVYALYAFTDTVTQSLTRGQNLEQLTTLSARTVAWEAVLATPIDRWEKWIGIGLAAKLVPVQERWRDEQVLDSSWVSILAQAGLIGTVLLLAWVVMTAVDSLRRRDLSALTTPLMAVLLIRSITENGLIESSPTFVLFLAIALILERGTLHPAPPSYAQWLRARKTRDRLSTVTPERG